MNNKTLLEVLEEVQNSGYTEEIRFHKKNTHLHAISKDIVINTNDFTLYDESNQEQKFGVPKIYKIKFEEDPDRYELRKGFPDFPACPYGNSFSMLGFDKKQNRYVWLVSSIIKDDRLKVNEYSAN